MNEMITVERLDKECGFIVGAIKDNGDGETSSVQVRMEHIGFTQACNLIQTIIESLIDKKPGFDQIMQAAVVTQACDMAIGNVTCVRPFERKPCERKDFSDAEFERVTMDKRLLDMLEQMGGDI